MDLISAGVIESDMISNVILIDQDNFDAFEAAEWNLIDTEPLGLRIGDYTDGTDWYRDGQKLPITDPSPTAADYQAYYEGMQEVIGGE